MFLSLARKRGPHELVKARRGKDGHPTDGISPKLDTEIHVPAGMNTVTLACTFLARRPHANAENELT